MLVLTQDFRGGGGAEKFIANLSLALRDQVDFTFVYPVVPNPGDHQFPYHGKLIPLDLQWIQPAVRPDQKAARLARRLSTLAGIIRREQPDVVFSNFSFVWHYLAVVLRSSRLISPKVVLRFGNSLQDEFDKRDANYLRFFKAMVRRADRVVANSQGVGDDLVRLAGVPAGKVVVINNPVAVDEIIAQSQAAEPRLPFDDDAPLILSAGRLEAQKNHALLIRAFHRVRQQQAVHLAILGTGQLEGDLRRLVQELGLHDDVVFLGWQSNPYPYMRRAAVFALSSNFEGFPNALLEAMACGAPVVATDCPHGPSDILMSGRYGVLTPIGDEIAMARAIASLLDDGDLRRQLTILGKLRASEYGVSRSASQYVDLFHALAH